MPFQDIDEAVVVEAPPPPTAFERWLRKIFVEDWSLKLLALAITLVLWFAVAGQNEPVTIRTAVQLNIITSKTLDISNDPPKTVEVLLTGSRNDLDQVSTPNLVATVDVSDQKPGERVIRLRDRARIDLVDGVQIESFQPSTITIRLEPLEERKSEIEVKLEGTPAEGYEVYGAHAVQDTVRIVGPVSRVVALKKVPTETVSVDGRKESFTIHQVAIDIPDQKIDLLDALVDVIVEIGEKKAEKSFSGVPALASTGGNVQPATAEVTLSGPASTITLLRSEDVKVVVDVANNGATVARVDLPASIKDKVQLISIKPSQFSVIR
jgi:YbbR-like protein